MRERLTIVDASRKPLGTKERIAVHRDGDWHETFHCWLWRDDFIFLQLRSRTKADFPNCFDITAAGHLMAGETVQDGVREIEEELGLRVRWHDLRHLGVFSDVIEQPPFIDREFAHTYAYRETGGSFKLQDEEVADVIRVNRRAFEQLVEGQRDYVDGQSVMTTDSYDVTTARLVPHPLAYWRNVCQAIATLQQEMTLGEGEA